MRRVALLLAACLFALAPAYAETSVGETSVAETSVGETPPAETAAPAVEPYRLVRTLHALQERIAAGDVAAHEAQRDVITHIGRGFAAADSAVWVDPRNARAAIAFALGGGPPQALATILASGAPFGAERSLAEGALAFLEGRETKARAALDGHEPLAVGGLLGAQLALARSALAVRESPREAMRFLAIARLLAPGTLVEEAALRREVFVAGQSGDVERLEFLGVQYMRRFRHSVYAGNFRQRFATLLTALDFDGDLTRFARLEAMLERFDAESRRDLYLFFARHSLINGRATVARRAATLAHALSAGGSDEEERATFYAAASQVTTDRFALAADTLTDVDAVRLPEADVLLLEAVLDVAAQIGAPVVPDGHEEEERGTDAVEAGEVPAGEVGSDAPEPSAQAIVALDRDPARAPPEPDAAPVFVPPEPTRVMRLAETALADIDRLIEGTRP